MFIHRRSYRFDSLVYCEGTSSVIIDHHLLGNVLTGLSKEKTKYKRYEFLKSHTYLQTYYDGKKYCVMIKSYNYIDNNCIMGG